MSSPGEAINLKTNTFPEVDPSLLDPAPEFILKATDMPELGEKRVGKVRDIYTQEDQILLIATDRYSAFDRNLATIPYKGEIATQISKFWFDKTKHIIDNHVIDYPDPNVTVGQKCQVIPVEMVVRGYITGVTNTSLWNTYQTNGPDFGDFVLPKGLQKNQRLPEPVVTPTTKFEKHDRPLTLDESVTEGLIGSKLRDSLIASSLALFNFGQDLAQEHGLLLVDTKYEFGLTEAGQLVLIDEIHTPDSSRYWQTSDYEERFQQGVEQDNYDKEYLRLWFRAQGDPYKKATMPKVPKDKNQEMSRRYIQVFQQLTGQAFQPELTIPIQERLRHNLRSFVR